MAIGTLTLGSHVDCDWLWITNGPLPDNVTQLEFEPTWNEHSKFLAQFNNTLRTGNLKADGTPPTSWAVYRQKADTDTMTYVTVVEGEKAVGYDYMPSNDTTYVYHTFARTESDMSEDKTSPAITPQWPGWILITLDPADEEGRFIPNEIFIFELNLEIGDMSNNTNFSKLETFTPYPIIQRSSSNHMSGQLKGLIGKVDCASGRYYDTIDQATAIRALTTNTRRKILKDLKGHVFEVELSSSVIFSVLPNVIGEPYFATLQWTEVASANDLRVVINADEYEDIVTPPYNKDQHSGAGLAAHTHPQSDIIGLVNKLNELDSKIEAYRYELPTASSTVKGGVRVGDTLGIDSTGVLDIEHVNLSDITQDTDLVIDLGNASS